MSTFEDLEESLLKTFNSSEKESLSEIGLDDEERDKIQHIVSSSISADLNVDFSQFENHIFFGSAYAAANFAAQRVISEFPFDGELKDKNLWKKINSPYENWFYEQYPKQQGYLYLQSGSVAVHPYVEDHQGLLSTNSGTNSLGSFCVEMVIRPFAGIPNGRTQGLYSYLNSNGKGHYGYIQNVGGVKSLVFGYRDDVDTTTVVSASFNSYISSSHMVSYVWDSLINSGSIYVDGTPIAISGTDLSFIGTQQSGAVLRVGSYNGLNFSGNIDDFRYWVNGNQTRSEELIKRNYYRPIHANISGGLRLYWKFNQPEEYGNKVIDQSGNELHGTFSGNFSYSENIRSGTLGSWFKDVGDPIMSLTNERVNSFIEEQRLSGSNFDDDNQNLIYNLAPSFFTSEEEDTEYQKLFLLLTARHFDRLKLYIDNLSNLLKLTPRKFNGPPANLLDVTAKHYGVDIGDIYAGSDALQYFFGENVYSSGSMQDSLAVVKNTLKRNIVSNLNYLIKSKSTQEAIKAALHSVGLNENIVSINEFSDLSGGIATTFSPKTVESRVLRFLTSSNAYIDAAQFNSNSGTLFQFRTLFNTASVHLTQSIFNYEFFGTNKYHAEVIRQNLTSSNAKLVLTTLNSVFSPISIESSYLPMFDNEWVNFSLYKSGTASYSFYVSSIDRSGLIFSESQKQTAKLATDFGGGQMFLGTSGTNYFEGYMHEFKGWNSSNQKWQEAMDPLSASAVYERYGYDWTLSEVPEIQDISNLKVHLMMNDYTGSTGGTGPLHDSTGNTTGSYYSGLSSSADFNFPGKYLSKFDVALSYDLNIDNDKIRIKNQSTFNQNDQTLDIPFVSIDFSPITPLNKEIMRWIGDLSKFSNITADPMLDFREDNLNLSYLREAVFSKRFDSKLNFSAFSDLIKWFDNNFTYLLSQFIPLDLASSLSNYIIEPHLLEYNKVRKSPRVGSGDDPYALETIITAVRTTTAQAAQSLDLADPGRFGSFVSSSADLSPQFVYTSSSNGLNHSRYHESAQIRDQLRNNSTNSSPRGYGNAFYTTIITGANYLKNSLNVIENFNITGVHYLNDSVSSEYLSSSYGQPGMGSATGSVNGIQDARWLWMLTRSTGSFNQILYDDYFPSASPIPSKNRRGYQLDYGIGYGGMWGQLSSVNKKSTLGVPKFVSSSYDPVLGQPAFGLGYWIGQTGVPPLGSEIRFGFFRQNPTFSNYIEYFENSVSPTKILWPRRNAHGGVVVDFSSGQFKIQNGFSFGLGEEIEIEKYNSLNVEILGKVFFASDVFTPTFTMKFQFYSRETPGDSSFETELSSSKSGDSYKNKSINIEYNLSPETQFSSGTNNSVFQINFKRPIPKQKYMRVNLDLASGEAVSSGSMAFVVRGIFSEDKLDEEVIKERG